MGGTLDYSTTAGSNTTVGGVNIAEGMQAGLVNNGMRAMMADSKKWQLDWSGIVTAGTSNAYTITSNQGIAAYSDGLRFTFRADRNNTGAATLNVDTRGAKALRKVTGGALAAVAADDIVAEAVYDVVYDLSSDVFVIVGFSAPTISAFAQTILDDADAAAVRTTIGAQASDTTLTALAGYNTNGILVQTAADTFAGRSVTSTDASITIINPAGVAGDIDLSVSGRKLLATKTASASATLDFTEFANSTYSRYLFVLKNVKPATDSVDLLVRLSTDAGATYDAGASDYDYAAMGMGIASSTFQGDAANSSIQLTGSTGIGNAATEFGASGDVQLLNAGSSSNYARVRAVFSYDSPSGWNVVADASGRRLAAQDTTGIRFLMSSGNIASGTIEMWGLI